ncbi:hypothetical protein IRJ41_001670 [Triplophysa rosa]|uniref:Uncharacterized protein n=1 Tax=Triplophysa rosa TaxID=992332 RepID=A0A9W7WQ03_TRIRA|nr:hypothetical protein IRJ41_001670 [Triplophysa rosa]
MSPGCPEEKDGEKKRKIIRHITKPLFVHYLWLCHLLSISEDLKKWLLRKMPSPGKFWASDQRLKSIPRLKRCDDIGLPARSRLVQRDVGEIQLYSHLLLLSFPITHLLYPGKLSSNREAGRKKEMDDGRRGDGGEKRQADKEQSPWLLVRV